MKYIHLYLSRVIGLDIYGCPPWEPPYEGEIRQRLPYWGFFSFSLFLPSGEDCGETSDGCSPHCVSVAVIASVSQTSCSRFSRKRKLEKILMIEKKYILFLNNTMLCRTYFGYSSKCSFFPILNILLVWTLIDPLKHVWEQLVFYYNQLLLT